MRIIFHTDDLGWNTGFGREAHNLAFRFKRARPEWEVGALHWNYRGQPMPSGFAYTLLPDAGAGHFENARLYIERFQPDIYFTLYDIFVSGAFMPQLSEKASFLQNVNRRTKWLSYFVFDIERWSAPRAWQAVLDLTDVPVAMSKYGQASILENYGILTHQIYHGVDMESFPPLPKEKIQERREAWGNPDFVMGAFFRNIARKQTAMLLEAWSRVSREYPDARLLMNMQVNDPMGFDLLHYLTHFNMLDQVNEKRELVKRGPVILTNQQSETWGVPLSELNLLYQCCDAQVLPTQGEGFGKPIVEGYAACGLPVIMSHNTTYDELVGDHGLPIKCEGYLWSKHEGAQTVPKQESLENCLRLMIDDANLRRKFAAYNKKFAQQFDYDSHIIPQWLRLLEETVGEGTSQSSTPKQTAPELAALA